MQRSTSGRRAGPARLALSLAILLAPTLLSACRSLPDVAPFSDATHALRAAVRDAGETTARRIDQLDTSTADDPTFPNATPDPKRAISQRPDLGSHADDLRTKWEARNNVLNAFCDYADALTQTVAAANSASESAQRVTTAASKLVTSVTSLAPGGSTAIDAAAALVAKIYEQIARQLAGASLEEATTMLDPFVTVTAEALSLDFAQLQTISRKSRDAVINSLRDAYRIDIKRLSHLRKALSDIPEDQVATSSTYVSLMERISLEAASPWRASYTSALEDNESAHARLTATLDAASALIKAWADAHTRIAIALRERETPNLSELAALTDEILALRASLREKATP